MHVYKVGDILVSSWGYDQTNIDFFEVVGVTPASVKLCAIRSSSSPETSFMTAEKTARKGEFVGKPFTRRANGTSSVHIHGGYQFASLWDGKAERYSWYA